MEFDRRARELRAKLTTMLMDEKIVPKRWRPIFTFPTLDMARSLIDHIIDANNIFPYKPEFVDARKAVQLLAIDDVDHIDDQLQYLVETLFYHKVSADQPLPPILEECGELIDQTRALLVGWRKSTKLVKSK